MANRNSSTTPLSIATTKFTLHGHRYELAQITARCWVVTSLQTGNTWQVAGAAGLKAWRKNASAWLKANRVTVREDVLVAACSLPTDPGAVSHEPVEVREARAAEWDRVRLSGIEAAERMKAKGDSQRVTARILGDVLANENETVNQNLGGME